MDEVRDQEVGIEILGGGERADRWVRQHGVVLENYAGGKVTSELVVPLAADDVVCNCGEVSIALANVLQQIGIVDAEPAGSVEGEGEVAHVLVADGGSLASRGIVVHTFSRNKECGEINLLEPAGAGLDSPERLRIGGDARERAVVERTQPDVVVGKGMNVDVGAARHVHAEARHCKVLESSLAVVPDIELLQRGAIGNEEFSFGTEIVAGIQRLFADVHAVDKAGFGDEAGAVIHVERLQVELASRALEVELVAGPGGTGAGNDVHGGTGHGLALHAPVRIELEVGVQAANTVVATAEFAIGIDSADGRLIENVAADAGDGERGAVTGMEIGRRQGFAWCAIVSR